MTTWPGRCAAGPVKTPVAEAADAQAPAARRGLGTMPGDEIIRDAAMVMDRRAELEAPAGRVWPWIAQLGKGRGGWYLRGRLERMIPRRNRALREIDPSFQNVQVGDRVEDYGRDGWFEARIVEPPHTLVWWSRRSDDLELTWALVLAPTGPESCELRVRLRINRAIGGRSPALVQWGAKLFDRLTIAMMIGGLRERLGEAAHTMAQG